MKRLNLLLAAVGLVALSVGTAAAEDVAIERVARIYNNLDHLSQVKMQDGFAYVAAGVNGLQIFDVSVPEKLTPAGFWNENDQPVAAIALDDRYIYAVGGSEILALDVADATAPQLIGSLSSDLFVDLVAVLKSGDYLYIEDWYGGTWVVNASDPANLNQVGSNAREAAGTGMAIYQGMLAIGEAVGNISLYDLSDPVAPALLNTFDVQAYPMDIVADGDYLYAACGRKGFKVFQMDGADLQEVGSLSIENSLNSLAIDGEQAYIASSERSLGEASTYSMLETVDISNPENPELLSRFTLAEDRWLHSIAFEDDHAVVVGDYGLLFYVDLVEPTVPVTEAQYQDWGWAQDVAVFGNTACIAERTDGFRAVDISDPVHPAEIYSVHTGMANAVVISEGYAYMLNGDMGLFVYDLNPDAPRWQVGFYPTGYYNWDLAVQGRVAYIVNQARQLVIVDFTDPANPVELGLYPMQEIPHSILVRDGIAYVASTGITAIDVSSPSSSSGLGSVEIPGVSDFALDGEYIYAVCKGATEEERGLRVVSAWDGERMDWIASLNTGSENNGVAVKNGYAFIADGSAGIRLVDVRDPQNPIALGVFDTPGSAVKIQEQNGLLYVADHTNFGIYRFNSPNGVIGDTGKRKFVNTTSLLSAYPNPFNSVTRLAWSAPASSSVRLSVYSITGARVADLVNGVSPGGTSEALFNANGLPAGAYVIRLESAGESWSQPVRLVR